MKKILIAVAAISMLVYTTTALASSREQAVKEKKVHNQYTVQDMDKLVVDNIYGQVHINTWDKNEVTIDITVTTKAKSESDAQEMLDRISFVMSSNEDGGHKIYCKTVLEPQKHNIQNSEMKINYTINAPKKIMLDIINKYGDVYLGDHSGKMRMNVSYGALDMQNITGSDKRIKVAFGSVATRSIETGMFDVSYSNVTIDKAQDIEVVNKYGKLDIEDAQNLKLEQKYGDVELGTVSTLTGNIDYANLTIDNLLKGADLYIKYSGKTDLRSIGANVSLLNIEAQYSSLVCHFAEGANLSLDVMTSYSSIKKEASYRGFDMTVINQSDLGNTGHYKVKVGKGEQNAMINARYSNISLK